MVKDLTTGSPAKLILMFTLPLIVGNVFQQLYLLSDTLIVGRLLGVSALAAVGCSGCLMFFIDWICNRFYSWIIYLHRTALWGKR